MFDFRKELGRYSWERRKVIQLVWGSYRHRVDIICSPLGKNIAEFENGPHPYSACVRLLRADGTEITDGNCIVPRLPAPDYKLLMVRETRPALDENGALTLVRSLEFPGGAIDAESVALGCLRECREETGIPRQRAILYRHRLPVSPLSSDIICRNHYCALYLSEGKFESIVETDGGLEVLALAQEDIERMMWDGTVTHGPSHLAWHFYLQVKEMRPQQERALIAKGYLTREEVTV